MHCQNIFVNLGLKELPPFCLVIV